MDALVRLYRGLARVFGSALELAARSRGFLTFAALVVLYCAIQRPAREYMITGDGHYTYLWARSLAFDRDFDLKNDYELCGDFWNLGRAGPRLLNYWGVGDGILRVPFLWLGKLVMILPKNAPPRVVGGCAGPIANIGMFGSAFFAAGSVWLGFRLARRYVGDHAAWLAMLVVALASPLFCYATVLASRNHASSAFICALFVERWDRHKGARKTWSWTLLGLVGGLVICTRVQSGLVIVLPFVEWCIGAVSLARRRAFRKTLVHVAHGVVFAIALFVATFPQLWAWHVTTGRWIGENHIGPYMRWTSPELGGPLFFPYSGLLSNNPLLWISVLGMIAGVFSRRTRAVSLASIFCFAGTVYVVGSAWDWWGASGFPGRRFCEDAGILVLGGGIGVLAILRLLERYPRRVATAAFLLAAAVGGLWSKTIPFAVYDPKPAHELHAAWVGAASKEVEETIGNPLSYPSALLFALRYGAHPRRYDAMAPFLVTYEAPEGPALQRAALSAATAEHDLFFERGFHPTAETVQGRTARIFCGKGRLLVPLFAGNIRTITVVWAFRGVQNPLAWDLAWNGERHTLRGDGAWVDTPLPLAPGTTRPGVNVVDLTGPDMCVAIAEIRFAK